MLLNLIYLLSALAALGICAAAGGFILFLDKCARKGYDINRYAAVVE